MAGGKLRPYGSPNVRQGCSDALNAHFPVILTYSARAGT
jgi:hypothetical protein